MASADTANDGDSEVLKAEVVGKGLVKAPSAALAAALTRADEYRRHTKAEATETAYKTDWKRFRAWADANGASPLPATPEVISAHLGWLAEGGYSVATMERFLSAGSHYHRAQGHDFPRGAFAVSETLKGIRRRVGVKRAKKAPLGLKALAEVCERLRCEEEGAPEAERLLSLRNRAMLTVGWFCMLRSANLVAIRREHVRLVRAEDDDWVDDDERPNGLIVHLPSSKTDQLKEGRDVGVHAQADETICPVHTLLAHLRATRFAPEDRIFPVSARTLSRLIKRLVANPEHDHSVRDISQCESCSAAARRFASHSLRRGAATAQAKKGISEREIMRHGGWKNERVMRGYIEHATLFENNPTKGLSGKSEPQEPYKEERMGDTTFDQKIEEHFDELVIANPECAKVTAGFRKKILDGFYQQWLVDAFFQKWRGKPSLAETHCFAQLYASYVSGEVGVFHVKLPAGPLADKNTKGNQALLDELPDLFEARFMGGPGFNDGNFEWKEPIKITRCFAEGDSAIREELWECAPNKLSLEVGYTSIGKTFEHIVGGVGVARWPYGHEMIIALVTHPSLRKRRQAKMDEAAAKHSEKP